MVSNAFFRSQKQKLVVYILAFCFIFVLCYQNNWSLPISVEVYTVDKNIIRNKHRQECTGNTLGSNQWNTTLNGRDKVNGTWYQANGYRKELYIYNAFYDDRHSLGTLPVIRVIAVSDLTENDKIDCVVWFYGKGEEHSMNVSVIKNLIGAGAYRRKKLFQEYIFTCELKDENLPKYVSVHFREKLNEPRIPVEIPVKYEERLDLGLCVSLSYWYHDPYRIVEWIELQRMLGVQNIIVYNNSLAPVSGRVFDYYDKTESDFFELRQSRNFMSDPGELTFHLQMAPVLNDCMYRNMYRFHNILVVDLDEMIVPAKFDKITSLLKYIETLIKKYHPARCYAFRNAYFFSDYQENEQETSDLITSRYIHHAPISDMGYASKSIINPMSCVLMHNHYCWQFTKLYKTNDVLVEVAPGFGFNRHYKKCHLDNCKDLLKTRKTDKRMLEFKSKLIKIMNEKLEHLNIDPIK